MKGIAFLSGLISALLTSGIILPATAQVTSDNTTNTTINITGNNFNILNGIQKGNNLFHSFKEFSIPTGGSAIFNNSADVVNIINRITGGNVSNIDGLIKANGNANLFLINPAGIIFRENAKINIGGSFLGTTAESLVFDDGAQFSANNTSEPPLLSINVPIGIQFGNNPGKIQVQGSGHQIIFDTSTFSFIRDARPVGLQVPSSKTLALIGGDISVKGGNLTAGGGRIELGSVAESARVKLIPTSDGFTTGYDGIFNFGDISLSQEASVEVSGEGGGNIQLQGRQISLIEDSAFIADTLGKENGGLLSVNASESVNIIGSNVPIFPTGFFNQVAPNATGNGGNITIKTPQLTVGGSSLIQTTTSGFGNGGDLSIDAEYLSIVDGAQIAVTTIDSGNSGNLLINAKTVEVLGTVDSFYPTAVFADTFSKGQGGNLIINTENLSVRDGAQLSAGSFGEGNGGNFIINANNIELTGTSGLFVDSFSSGNSGNLVIETENFSIADGSQISAGSVSEGKGGNINVRASKSVEIIGKSKIFNNFSLLSSSTLGTGNSGNITIDTPYLRVAQGGSITSSTFGSGDAGLIEINADRVEISDAALDFSNTLNGIVTFVSKEIVDFDGNVIPAATGNGGSITINGNLLSLKNGGQIDASTLGEGVAGNINLNFNEINLTGISEILNDGTQIPSRIISASETDFAAGSVKITANKLSVNDSGEISVSSIGSGDAGNLIVNARAINLNNQGNLRAEVAAGRRGNITVDSNFLLLRHGSQITTSATGTASGGNITINSPVIAGFENSDIIANAVEGNGGNINITTQGLFGLEFREQLTSESDITASSEFGLNGKILINNLAIDPNNGLVELSVKLPDESQKIATGCSINSGNSFVTTGRGGIPHNLNQSLNLNSIWLDIRNLSTFDPRNINSEVTTISNKPAIIEATGFVRNQNGEIELVAAQPKPFSMKQVAC